jgi:hypothetical protein
VWLSKDLGTWGFWISIIAFISAYPLSLLANITSPRLLNWWATTSRVSLEKRIAQLHSKPCPRQLSSSRRKMHAK